MMCILCVNERRMVSVHLGVDTCCGPAVVGPGNGSASSAWLGLVVSVSAHCSVWHGDQGLHVSMESKRLAVRGLFRLSEVICEQAVRSST